MPRIILASQSPQRKMLFETVGVPFEVIPADIDEKAIQHADEVTRARQVAWAKAEKVAAQYPSDIIIAADTYVVCKGRTLEKPLTKEAAKDMLRFQSGQWITALTGYVYIDPALKLVVNDTVSDRALVRKLSEVEIDRYVTNNRVTTWSAGFSPAFAEGIALFARLEGSLHTFCYGLPLDLIVPLLKRSHVLK